ncbi:MAG TPA: hypothetical protein DDY98_05410 [Ruminococcaceae bacterium]|nr:hypothetical protein [Oscillospiraceae bacterium]
MTALWIILGIILFFVAVLSVRVTVFFDYNEKLKMDVRWLFLKVPVYPTKPKKKKPKKQKEEKPKEEKKEEPKPKKENMFKTFYKNQGFYGVMELLGNVKRVLGGMFSSMGHHFVFRELKCYFTVGAGDDAAATSMLYGKTCAAVFPIMGLITNTCHVKEYDCAVRPDFIKGEKSAVVRAVFSVRPIFYINALLACGVKLFFQVILKFMKGAKAPKATPNQIVNNSKEE